MEPEHKSDDSLPPSHRIPSLDALRGFALGGILLSVVQTFNQSLAYPSLGPGLDVTVLDQGIRRITEAVINERFISIFSLLFGFGLAMQWDRAARRGVSPVGPHWRRMACLALCGILNTTFLWFGEILLLYAVFGVILLALRRAPVRLLVGLSGVVFLFFGVIWDTVLLGSSRIAATIAFKEAHPLAEMIETYRRGGIGASSALRWSEYVLVFHYTGPWLRMSLAMMLLGLAAGRSAAGKDFLLRPSRYAFASWMVTAFGLFFMVAVFFGWPLLAPVQKGILLYYTTSFGVLASTFAIVWIFLWSASRPRGGWLVDAFAPLGRMTLTGYVGGATVFALLFHHYGFSLYRQIGKPSLILIGLGVFVFFAVFARLWLRRFRQGPLEWIWRRVAEGGLFSYPANPARSRR